MQITTSSGSPEARAWLRANPSASPLATNRFGTIDKALAFVDQLYALGAAAVLIDEVFIDADGYPYGDTLLVQLPEDPEARLRIERFCEEEGPIEVPGDFRRDALRAGLRLWWD